MKTIDYHTPLKPLIKFGRIKPFQNRCAVTGELEWCNAEIEYIPSDKLIDIVDYRKWFAGVRNQLIEEIAANLYNEIMSCARPAFLCVRVYLEGNPNLTDWSVEIKST